MSIEFLNTDFEKVSYLASLLTAHATGKDASSSDYQQLRHELLSNSEVAGMMPDWLKIHRNLDSFWGFIQPKFPSYAERRTFLAEEFSTALSYLEFGHKTTILQMPEVEINVNSNSFPMSAITFPMKKVFIVHGRDNEVKQEVSRFIESIGLVAIILHEQASSGMTIIEKIEHYAGEADFALVLYTPCDRGRGAHESQTPPKNRARQNVVFEHGYLMARLGRKNVCALVKDKIETPNDISGVVYVDLDIAGAWKLEVIKELKGCGYIIA